MRVVAENARGTRLDTDETSSSTCPTSPATGPQITTPFVFRGRTARDIQQVRAAAAPLPAATRDVLARPSACCVRFDAYGPAGIRADGHDEAAQPQRRRDRVAAGADEAGNSTATSLSSDSSSLPPGDYLIEIAAEVNGEITRQLLGIG